MKKALEAVKVFALSPAARRYEIPLAIGIFEAIRTALGHA